MGGKKNILPSGYKQLEYISNEGTSAYIDTGLLVDQDTRIYMKTYVNRHGCNFLGCRTIRNSPYIPWIECVTWDVYFYGRYGNSGDKAVMFKVAQHLGDVDIIISRSYMKVQYPNGFFVEKEFDDIDFECPFSLFIGACNQQGSPYVLLGCKIYYFEIESKGTTKKFIPCINPNNVVGMYDLVEGMFYSSPNGVAFIAGNPV